ncbi:hypothetical protein HOE67_04725, partial [Candidatus Peregrinibacteria bacterium]|nr:hypothetical protein [Candidatus Peregrinibacteria bacterium]
MGNLDWDAEGDAIVDALVDDGVSFSGAEVSQILESLKDVEASGGDVSKIRSETGLKILKGLFALNADFIDHTVTPEMIAEDYREGRAEHGVVPFEVDIEGHLEALQRHTQETYVAVAALSIGGTNIIAGEARISGTGDIDVGMLGFKEFEDLPYEKGEDFWQAVLPEGSFEIFKKAVEDGKLDLGSTIAHPVEDGCLRPGKYTCPELTDGSTKVEDSLGTFVGEHGIAAKEDIHMA